MQTKKETLAKLKSRTRLSKKPPLSAQEIKQIDAYWRASNYLTACQLYLLDNPLLERPLSESRRSSGTGVPAPGRTLSTRILTVSSNATIWT